MKIHLIKSLAVLLFGVAAFGLLMAYRASLSDTSQRAICAGIAASILAGAVVVGKRMLRAQKK